MSHQHEIAEYGEPLDIEDKGMRIRVFKHGRRAKIQLEHLLPPPFRVTKPKNCVDTSAPSKEDKGRSTT